MLTRLLRDSVLPTACFLGTLAVFSPQAMANQTQAQCVPIGQGEFETVMQQGSSRATLIRWTHRGSAYFGGQYTPEGRCRAVTQRLSQAMAQNGGRLGNLLLTNGMVNNETVICALGPMETACTSGNMLFTLKPENAYRAGQILGQLLQISRYGGAAGFITETEGQTYVNLGDWADQALVDSGDTTPDSPAAESTVAPEPSPQENPVVQPDNSGGSMF